MGALAHAFPPFNFLTIQLFNLSTFQLFNLAKKKLPKDVREVQSAAAEASWDALERYRDTGEMVPVMKDGKLALVTVDEAMRMRPDYEERKAANAAWRRKNLIDQFALAGLELTPDVWERLEADRRQALEDDLAWIRRGCQP